MIKSPLVNEINMTADELVSALLNLSSREPVCILDSCGIGYADSHLLIAGITPIETLEISHDDPQRTLNLLDEKLSSDQAAVFTLSYGFGMKLLGIAERAKEFLTPKEPDVFIAMFDALIVHDYDTGKTILVGNNDKCSSIALKLRSICKTFVGSENKPSGTQIKSNFSKSEYLAAIGTIQERIRSGDTYQTNLSQQITAKLPKNLPGQSVFHRLRNDHPAPFSAFIQRKSSTVISASPELFFRLGPEAEAVPDKGFHSISTSPIKGTRPRGTTLDGDTALRTELLNSPKDRAENTMIVDLLRNDLGRICEFGSVLVRDLCRLEEHPTFFHLVSTIDGRVRSETKFSDILRAVFPCGSITGAPKIRTMQIIDEIETADRGLSMGAIGIYVPEALSEPDITNSKFPNPENLAGLTLSVAIRTMVVRDHTAVFNVGGGIVIDSDPESEYAETLLKAKALLRALGLDPEIPPIA